MLNMGGQENYELDLHSLIKITSKIVFINLFNYMSGFKLKNAYNFFSYFSTKTLCCGYSKEPSQ